MKKSLFILLILISFKGNAIEKYPKWFIYPQLYPELITGFCIRDNMPVTDAEIMYCLYQQCHVTGYLETIETTYVKYLKNSEYYYVYSKQCLENIKEKLHHIDGFCNDVLSNAYVFAFSVNTDYKLKQKYLLTENLKKPDWLGKSVWEEDGFYYSVGMFTSIGNENDAWKTSEENAMFNIITSVAVNVFSLVRIEESSENLSKYINYVRIDVDFELKNIETLERWPDIENQYYYTLVRIKKSDITEL